ncbi:uncharacterized protein LOC112880016 [Panicum hallii]|uniref:uncharacterized protein LOC112880016 n=1 Tax=Panicum hallii TaxID=206008 RepID=UPI000DF4E1C0|nr:uncharacterized protein LOC112880016 [Panicum hallii]
MEGVGRRKKISDALDEILLRLPPSDPSGLVCASAVCKPWLRTLSDPAFLRRYRTFHGTPLALGFLRNPEDRGLGRFVPTSSFRPAAHDHRTCYVLDCRHGRALMYDYGSMEFVVWDPITGRERRIHDEVPDVYTNHAVLCAAGAGCDHSGCSGGPFLLACVGLQGKIIVKAYGCIHSSEAGAPSVDPTYLGYIHFDHHECDLEDQSAALVGGALHFFGNSGILRYDVLGGRRLSVIELPPANFLGSSTIVMTAENGGLGLATLDGHYIGLWSTETGPDGNARWAHLKFIDLEPLLPAGSLKTPALSGFAEDANVIFMSTDDGTFTITLKSMLARKVCEMGKLNPVFPYVSFYTAAACARGTLAPPVGTQ